MDEHPTREQGEQLRAAGYTAISTLNGILMLRSGVSRPWRETFDELERDDSDVYGSRAWRRTTPKKAT